MASARDGAVAARSTLFALVLVLAVDASANVHGMPDVPADEEQEPAKSSAPDESTAPREHLPEVGLYAEPGLLLGTSWGTGTRQPGAFIHRLAVGMHFAVSERGPAFRVGLAGELSIDETPKNYSAIGLEISVVMPVSAVRIGPRFSIMAPYSAEYALSGGLRLEWKSFVGGLELKRVVGGLNQSRDAYGAHVLVGLTRKAGAYVGVAELVVGAVVGFAIASAIPY